MATKTQENGSAAAKQETSKTVIAENRGGWSLRRKKKNKHGSVETPPRSQSADNLTGDSVTFTEPTPGTPTSVPSDFDISGTAGVTPTANGDMKPGVGVIDGSTPMKTPPTERKPSRFATLSRIFKPWKWRRRKKERSEKLEKTAIDLERKISVRTSREELIKRGVLREVDENGEPIIPNEAPIPEEDEENEAVKEDSYDGDHKQANGSTPSLSHDADPAHSINSDASDGVQTPASTDNSISLSPEYYTRGGPPPPQVTHIPVTIHSAIHPQYGQYGGGDDYQNNDPSMVEPRQIRVMLPVDKDNKSVPVLQKIPVLHDPPDYKPSPPPEPHHHTPVISSAYSHSPMLNNNIYTPTGLTYPTPTLKTQTFAVNSPSTPVSTGYTEIAMKEPDLQKKPLRSAMKGAKSKQMLQQQLQQKLSDRRNPPKVAPKPKKTSYNMGANKENEMYDNIPDYDNINSDSDEEVQYDDRDKESILAARVQRSDSLAKFLAQRPPMKMLVEMNIIHGISDNERQLEKDLMRNRLTRRLSMRPTTEDLENRNILHSKSTEQFYREKEEKKKTLVRKLSFRPTVEELRGRKIIMFSDYVEMTHTSEYERRADKPWTRLTPKDKAAIRKELNEFKSSEMEVHDDSRHLTRFHRP